MTRINFKNALSDTVMYGGGNYPIRLTSLDGLEFVPKKYHTVTYSGTDGADTVCQVHDRRVITGSGDIFITSKLQLNNLCNVFSEPGILTLTRDNVTRKTKYKPSQFDIKRKNEKCFVFTFQIICDNPCFEALNNHNIDLFKRENLVFGSVSLPAVFTKRINEAKFINKGHKKAEPVIYVKYISDASGSSKEGFVIRNKKTNQEIKFTDEVKKHGTVIFNISDRTVKSKDNENLEKYITQDTYLSDFFVDTGLNDFEFINLNTSENVVAELSYLPLYLGVY